MFSRGLRLLRGVKLYPALLRSSKLRLSTYPVLRADHEPQSETDSLIENRINALSEHPKLQELFTHPEVVVEIKALLALFKTYGVDVTSGPRPNLLQLMKLMQEPKIKEQMAKLQAAADASGIVLDSSSLSSLMKL